MDTFNATVVARIVDRVREAITSPGNHAESDLGGQGVYLFPLASERDEAARCHTFRRSDTPEILRALLTIAEQDGDLDALSGAMDEIVEWRADVLRERRREELKDMARQAIASLSLNPEAAQ